MLCDAGGRREGLMTPYIPPLEEPQFAHAGASRTSLSEVIFRIVRWSTYAGAILTLILVLHKTPPPPIETSPQAAARAEQKFEEAERTVANGQPATLRMDETELNSYLSSHLELSGNGDTNPVTRNEQPRTSAKAGTTA